tara:strand:+ start:15485 stop:17275 length:1791 start_codon:yes stop_codon:yes gene_type:complete
MPKKQPSIDYTSRDFASIRADLEAYAQRYYPDNFKDFTEASFGSLMLDTVAYVGDMLSFYVDYQANESFLSTAMEFNNVLKLSNSLGYKFKPYAASFGTCDFYVTIPVESNTIAPDQNYMPLLRKGSTFLSVDNTIYTLIEDVDFSKSTNEIVVASQDASTGAPLYYAVKASGQVVSGETAVQEVSVGELQKFLRIKIDGTSISEIVSVFDSNGNQYYEVDYLSQNIIYVPLLNKGDNSDTVPFILKPVSVSRRFMVDTTPTGVFLQFGFGSDESPVELKDPSEVVLQLHGKDYFTAKSFDPSVLIQTDKLGVVPSNTMLTIIYRVNNNENVNAASNSITRVGEVNFQWSNFESLDSTKIATIRDSIGVTNPEPIVGDTSLPTSEEVKQRAISNFASQYRAVTKQDYLSMVYNMPPKFGKIKRAAIEMDSDSYNQRNLNLYVISENTDGNLVKTNDALKTNLKTWVNQYKMVNDTVDILDAKIVNLGINFIAIGMPGTNKFDVLDSCTTTLKSVFAKTFYIGEPLVITDIYQALKSVNDVLDVVKVELTLKTGTNYSDPSISIEEAKSLDGRYLIAPTDTVFEIKFPNQDIKGTIQ